MPGMILAINPVRAMNSMSRMSRMSSESHEQHKQCDPAKLYDEYGRAIANMERLQGGW